MFRQELEQEKLETHRMEQLVYTYPSCSIAQEGTTIDVASCPTSSNGNGSSILQKNFHSRSVDLTNHVSSTSIMWKNRCVEPFIEEFRLHAQQSTKFSQK
jgi:hypothetical protein